MPYSFELWCSQRAGACNVPPLCDLSDALTRAMQLASLLSWLWVRTVQQGSAEKRPASVLLHGGTARWHISRTFAVHLV